MSISGTNNNFNPTIDGLTNFQLSDLNIDSLVVSGSINLPVNSIQDAFLSNNVVFKNQSNTYTGLNTFNGGLTVSSVTSNFNDNLNMNSSKIITFKDNFTTVSQTNVSQYNGSFFIQNYADPNISGGYIHQYVKNLSNTTIEASVLNYAGYYLKNGISIFIYNASNSNYLKLEQYLFNSYVSNFAFDSAITPYLIFRTRNSAGTMIENMKLSPTLTQITTNLTCSNGLTLSSGSLVLPTNSILDTYLSSNVVLKNSSNTFTNTNTFNGGLTVPSGLTLYNNAILDTYLSSNVCLLNGTQTITNKTLNDCVANTQLATDNSTKIATTAFVKSLGYLTGSSSISDSQLSSNIPKLNANNTFTNTNNFNGTLNLTSSYTYFGSGETPSGASIIYYDSTNIYGTSLSQSSTNYIIENQYNSSSIILRNKDATGTAVNHTFSYNTITLNSPITMGLNCNLTQTGSGRIIQASTTSQNIFSQSQFQGELNFAVGAANRINQTNGGNGALLRTLNMLANYDIIFDSGTGKIDQSLSTGTNLLTNTSVSNLTITGTFKNNTFTLTLPSSNDTLVGLSTTDNLTNKTLTTPIISQIKPTSLLTLTLPALTDTLVSRTSTDTLTNKTLTNPIISNIINTGTLTLPSSTDTLVGRATTDNLTNKTLTTPIISQIKPTSLLTLTLPSLTDTLVSRTSTDTLTNKTLTNPIISNIINTGTLTLPSSTDTLVGRATTDTLTNKTLTSPVISTIVNTGTITLPTSTDVLIGRNTTDTLTNKTLTNPIISNIINTGTLTLPSSTDTLVGRATTDTLSNKTISGGIFLGTNNFNNGSQILQYNSTNAVYTTLSQATTNSYLIENNYNSSSIYLRNKNSTGGSVNYIFSYDAMTIPTPLTINNNLIIPDYNLVLKNGTNQTNIFQFTNGLYFWNLNNSGTINHRVKNSTGTDVDAVVINSSTTTIATELTCQKNITLQSTFITPSSGQLGYKITGTNWSGSPITISSGTTNNLSTIVLPDGLWNIAGQFAYSVQTGGDITSEYFSISSSTSVFDANNYIVFGSTSGTTSQILMKRINSVVTGNQTLYLIFKITFSSGIYQITNASQAYTNFTAYRIA